MGGNGRSRLRRPGACRKRLQGVNQRVRARITGERFLQSGHVEDAVEAIQQRAPLRGEPDQGAAPVGRINVPFQVAVVDEVGDDLTDDRLGSLEMQGEFAHTHWRSQREMRQNRP